MLNERSHSVGFHVKKIQEQAKLTNGDKKRHWFERIGGYREIGIDWKEAKGNSEMKEIVYVTAWVVVT
jgi:hypothetical protein